MATDNINKEIHHAAFQGNMDSLQSLLIYNKSDINATTKKGNTPLSIALHGSADRKNKIKVLEFLIENGADVNAVNDDGDTILHIAVKNYIKGNASKKCVKLLLEHGADNTVKDSDGDTASKLAFMAKSASLGTLLLLYDKNEFDQANMSERKLQTKLNKNTTRLLKKAKRKHNSSVDDMDGKRAHGNQKKKEKKGNGLLRTFLYFIFPTCSLRNMLVSDLQEMRDSASSIPFDTERQDVEEVHVYSSERVKLS